MITDSYSKMMPDIGMRSMLQSNEYGDDLGLLLREQRRQEVNDRDRELSMYRSGSAPPTVEGSLNAVGGLFSHGIGGGATDFGGVSEEELRSDPSYISYYYSNVNRNPRLPPPLLSKEDWRFAQKMQGSGGGSSALGGIGDRRKVNKGVGEDGGGNRSLFSMQPGFNGKKDENGVEARKPHGSAEWGGDGLIGLPGLGLGSRQKSIAEIIQDDIGHSTSVSRHPSRPVSRNAFDDSLESSESHFPHHHPQELDALRSGTSSASHTYASALGASLSRSSTPDPQLAARAPSPRIPKRNVNGPNSFNGGAPTMAEPADLVSALSGMTLSSNSVDENHIKQHAYVNRNHIELPKPAMSAANSYLKVQSTPTLNSGGSSPSQYPNLDSPNSSFSNYGLSSYAINPTSPSMLGNHVGGGNLPPLFENIMGISGIDSRAMGGGLTLGPNLIAAAAELENLSRVGGNHAALMDPSYLQYLRSSEFAALNDATSDNSYMDLLGLQKAYLGAMLSSQKSQYGLPYLGKSSSLNHGYYGNPGFGLGMPYPTSPLAGSVFPNSPIGSGSSIRHGERSLRFPSGMRNLAGGVMGSWHSDNLDGTFASTLLDEFKTNKTKCFELSEISGHVVEFSADQYGSRFIQQKLETATAEEKNMVFHEIMPQALSLMTDVFGNYVIQKFFEHGTASQIRELADQLTGHVLTLSLQMYGCRVIQKAIEVVELDQQTKMVAELDGHIMRCVRDQNGNHVIQKCIECIPEDAIQFIITIFYDQVVTLSTHPYGCRVIQRVLEHCSVPKTQQIVMDEILRSVCMLAQDQYGNYVVQHVLEHGKPHERTEIITKLTGQIVQMSQQKFASNVVEKCLTFGTPEERQVLVTEMLGSTDENEPLQVMMKDQFANYVVQKVLETCDDQQLEMILNRIKVHLNALKKYTYGKHIVARVEKLVAAGERRIGILQSYATTTTTTTTTTTAP